MKPTIAGGVVGVLLLAGGTVPFIPSQMEWLYAYEYQVNEVSTGTSTPAQPAQFADTDGDGINAVAVFADKNGNKVYVQIPESQYELMGGVQGTSHNPVKDQYLTLFQALTPTPASAAIAFDNHGEGDSAGNVTSLTTSVTVNSNTNGLLMCGIETNTSGATITSVTYAGAALTSIKTISDSSAFGQTIYAYYKLTPATGANNVVVNTSSASISLRCASYTGVSQVGMPDSSTSSLQVGVTSTNYTATTTTVADNTWVYLMGDSDHGVLAAVTNAVLRGGGVSTNVADFDTNSAQTPAGLKSMTISGASTSHWMTIAVSFAPVVSAVRSFVPITEF